MSILASETPAGPPATAAAEDLSEWLLLAALELRPRLARRLLEELGGPGSVLSAQLSQLTAVEGVTPETAARITTAGNRPELSRWLSYAERAGLQVAPFYSAQFPALLNEIPDPPAALFIRGKPACLIKDAVAMVGTRAPSDYGKMTAGAIAKGLASSGVAVVSGGALGIDTVVHQAAVGAGVTVAVLGCGLDIAYPVSNQNLFNRITEQGAVVSEFPLGARPDSWRFPARNRIISGLSRGTVVVEAAQKSGALITAGFAGEQGREVMAVPGPVSSVRSRGCHALIRDGAALVENAAQVMEVLGWASPGEAANRAPAALPLDLPLEQGALLMALGPGQRHLDELTTECGLSPAQAGAAMTMLEMRGLVRRIPGSHFVRT